MPQEGGTHFMLSDSDDDCGSELGESEGHDLEDQTSSIQSSSPSLSGMAMAARSSPAVGAMGLASAGALQSLPR